MRRTRPICFPDLVNCFSPSEKNDTVSEMSISEVPSGLTGIRKLRRVSDIDFTATHLQGRHRGSAPLGAAVSNEACAFVCAAIKWKGCPYGFLYRAEAHHGFRGTHWRKIHAATDD